MDFKPVFSLQEFKIFSYKEFQSLHSLDYLLTTKGKVDFIMDYIDESGGQFRF